MNLIIDEFHKFLFIKFFLGWCVKALFPPGCKIRNMNVAGTFHNVL